MKIRLSHLLITTRRTIEEVRFSETVTFLYGPVGTGKSTVARLIDYCFGGDLERTPAIQQEFIAVTLGAKLGEYECTLERGAEENQSVRVTWFRGEEDYGSVNAPLSPTDKPLVNAEVYTLSDLVFYLCGVEPIRVLQRSRDPESPMIRLSFRDIWCFCYLDQTHLDSSFFRLEDPFRGRKSQDAMRFFTGLHSERLSRLQVDLFRTIAEQQGGREAVAQIRQFMARFDLGHESDIASETEATERELRAAEEQKLVLETTRSSILHPTDSLRARLREMSQAISDLQIAIETSRESLAEQVALRAELISTKIKSGRVEEAAHILNGVEYSRCPQCGKGLSDRALHIERCRLCGTELEKGGPRTSVENEAIRRELNDRIDQISDSISRRRLALEKTERQLRGAVSEKKQLDEKLQDELARYDSAFIESMRQTDRKIATLEERYRSLVRLQEMPRAINEIEDRAGASQGRIDRLRSMIEEERRRLQSANQNARAIAEKFKSIMLGIGFPGVSNDDVVMLDSRNWNPIVIHSNQEWGFWDTGSGGKKTLFNVCYALAVHEVARENAMPVPNILIVDSPTKNISDDENPALVNSLYKEIYRVAANSGSEGTQFLLIDSDLVEPEDDSTTVQSRRMAGESAAPSLISYYVGP